MEPIVINKEAQKPVAQDFFELRALGVKYLQELTGSFWTDYNEHDPGVTILEQLCYAITDLSFRTSFDIKDHIFKNAENEQAFLKPNEIFPCNSLTISDYRKMLFDNIFEIKNVWFSPVNIKRNSINGLYKVILDLDKSIQTDEEKEYVINKVEEVYAENRNLCEDLDEIVLLNNFWVSIHADVEVDGLRDAEVILAEVFYNVNEYLSPEIRFWSMEELQQEGYNYEDIFNGPLLKHGFIKEEELRPKSEKILISEVVKIIMQVKGVISVKNLYLKADGQIYENQIVIPDNKLPKLDTSVINTDGSKNVEFFRGSVNYSQIDTAGVKRLLNEFQSANKRVYRLDEEEIKSPEGQDFNLGQYYSIQNQFPDIYGIGPDGIPGGPNDLRKAQAKQLKAYLLLFEQVLANYLAQLSHVGDLFSLKSDLTQTYFYQSLEGVPGFEDLIYENSDKILKDPLLGDFKFSEEYEEGLKTLSLKKDNFISRRNRLLDYLLAVHGESFTKYSLKQFNYYFSEDEFEKYLIKSKTRLMKTLSFVNANRAKAFNYKKSSINTPNLSGLQFKISSLLGIEPISLEGEEVFVSKSLVNQYFSDDLLLIDESTRRSKRRSWERISKLDEEKFTEEVIEENYDYIDEEDFQEHDMTETQINDILKSTLPYKSNTLPTSYLREGLNTSLYRLGKPNENVEQYKLLFYSSEEFKWWDIGDFRSEQDATIAVQCLSERLRSFNIESEGMHIIEHTLFRPHVTDQRFGIYLNDENGNLLLRSKELYTYDKRLEMVQKLKEYIYSYNNYSVETTVTKDFEIHFNSPEDDINMVSLEAWESVEETHERMERLYNYLANINVLNDYKDKVAYYIRHSEEFEIVPEDFYTYRISIVLPSWTARFHNHEFRAIAEDVISEQMPANVASKCLWLSPEKMNEFEELYFKWLKEKENKKASKKVIDDLNNKLTQFLLLWRTNI